jgi:hypothetical protein
MCCLRKPYTAAIFVWQRRLFRSQGLLNQARTFVCEHTGQSWFTSYSFLLFLFSILCFPCQTLNSSFRGSSAQPKNNNLETDQSARGIIRLLGMATARGGITMRGGRGGRGGSQNPPAGRGGSTTKRSLTDLSRSESSTQPSSSSSSAANANANANANASPTKAQRTISTLPSCSFILSTNHLYS